MKVHAGYTVSVSYIKDIQKHKNTYISKVCSSLLYSAYNAPVSPCFFASSSFHYSNTHLIDEAIIKATVRNVPFNSILNQC